MTNPQATKDRERSTEAQSDSLSVVPSPPLAKSILRTARPKQWVKNVLVFAAPAAAGTLTDGDAISASLLAFLAFTLASSATYYINDALDVTADRLHPKKRHRPVAAGHISLGLTWTIAAIAMGSALAIAYFAVTPAFGGLLTGYIAMTIAYSTYLKRIAIVDLACVAAGFVLRMIGGGLATDIAISDWFLTVACFSSLFVVAGKRYAEMIEIGDGNHTRAVLRDYTPGFLRITYVVALSVSTAAYCQWAFSIAHTADMPIWYQLSAVPWLLALLRYALLLENGHGGAPEEVLMRDRLLQVMGALWVTFFLSGVYAN